jgi:hypothetical protein
MDDLIYSQYLDPQYYMLRQQRRIIDGFLYKEGCILGSSACTIRRGTHVPCTHTILWKKEFGHIAWKSIAGVASLDAISTT